MDNRLLSTSKTPVAARGVESLRRRVALGVAVAAFGDAVGVLALVGIGTVVVARLFGVALVPSPLWLLALLPAGAYAAARVRRQGLDSSAAAEHLDRRLGLSSLLASSVEADASAWSASIDARASKSDEVLPRVHGGRALLRAALPVAGLLATGLLPPPTELATPSNPLFREAVSRFESNLELAEKEKILEPEPVKEIRERVESLEKKAEAGETAPWSDLDALAEKLARATDEKARGLEHLSQEASALASGSAGGATPSPLSAEERLAALLEDAKAAGIASRIDPALAKELGLDKPGATVDLSKLAGMDAQQRAALAKALSEAAASRLGELSRSGLSKLGSTSLAELLASDPSADPFRDGGT